MATRLESSIEKAVCDRAFRKLGLINIKLNGPGRRGWPDRLFILDNGKVVFMEFKQKGKKSTPLQESKHKLLKNFKHQVEVCDDVDSGIVKLALAALRAS
jgi:hypothetical protein